MTSEAEDLAYMVKDRLTKNQEEYTKPIREELSEAAEDETDFYVHVGHNLKPRSFSFEGNRVDIWGTESREPAEIIVYAQHDEREEFFDAEIVVRIEKEINTGMRGDYIDWYIDKIVIDVDMDEVKQTFGLD